MLQDFNVFGEYNIPNVSICYPNRRKIGDLGRITSLSLDLKFNTYSGVSIEVPYEVDGVKTPHYENLVQKNKLHIDGYGYFIVQDVTEQNDGVLRKKTVPAYSEECALNYRSLNFLEGTYKFYDENPATETVLSKIMGYIPNWTLESVSLSLWSKYRTFDTTNATLYSFMMTNVAKAYECFFIFDTELRKIYVKDTIDIVHDTAIYLSHDNLIKNSNISGKPDEFVTALAVTGGGDLDIRAVNPLGSDFIYDFSYPVSAGQMSDELSAAVVLWNQKVTTLQPSYATKLTEYKEINEDLLLYQAQLTSLQSQKSAKELVMQSRIEDGQTDLSDLVSDIAVIEASASVVLTDINDATAALAVKGGELTSISSELSFSNNFTEELYNELLDFIIESSYQNENIIKTSVMDNVTIQEQSQELYDQGVRTLAKISQPRFEFSIDSVNLVFLKQYLQFTNLLALGSTLTVEIDETRTAKPILLEIKFNFYNPTEFSMTFGNRYRLDDSAYEFYELIQESVSKGSNIGVDSQLWTDWSKNYQLDVSSFVRDSFDASRNMIMNASNQEVIIDQVGLRGKRQLENGSYAPEQVWLTNNTLAFTSDGWNTVRTALGKITLPDTTTTYGLVADAIVTGTLNAGLVRIFGTNDFYWDNDAIVLHFPTDENKEIRIGRYDGTNYGIAFTSDGGDTWSTSIGFDGVVLSATDQQKLDGVIETVGDETDGLVKDVIDNSTSISQNTTQIALRVEQNTYYKAVPIYSPTEPSLLWDAEEKVANIGYLWYQTGSGITWKWNGLAWINTTSVDSETDPSLLWTSDEKTANLGYLWGDTNGESIIDFNITLPTDAEIQSGIDYILVCFDNTKIINTTYETVVGYYKIGDVVYCESVTNNNNYVTIAGDYVLNNWYNITFGGEPCKINQAKARAVTISEQTAYLGGYFQG